MAKNIIIGQSGGPTAVINSSLAGVYKAARSLGADKVYGMKYGIEGLLKEELLELNVLLDDRMSIELLKRTPRRDQIFLRYYSGARKGSSRKIWLRHCSGGLS